MRTAFKDWAVIVDALGAGEQILVLRKGGIHDRGGLFRPEHDRFWLFPTLFHQQTESVVPSARQRFRKQLGDSLCEKTVGIQYLAQVTQTFEVRSLDVALQLRGQHIWRDEVIEQRFDWGGERSVHALLLKVYSRPEPIHLPRLPGYGGCRSWIELSEDIAASDLHPVLSEDAFNQKQNAALAVLNESTLAK